MHTNRNAVSGVQPGIGTAVTFPSSSLKTTTACGEAMEEVEDLSFSQRMHAAPGDAQSPGVHDARHGKVVNDPIHKHFRLGPLSVQVMDTPQFQRLRDLKQLGLNYYVFPGAAHNRFEHSLGVAHLAYELAMHFKMSQPELEITSEDLKVVELAGLCHDLGHGPFSHVFHHGFLSRAGIHDWSHEEMSVKVLDNIVEDRGLIDRDLSEDSLKRVKAMILAGGEGADPEPSGRQFLHEIVANGRNGLDVDKFDYLARDAHCCGVPVAVDIDRLKTFSKVIDNEICYKWKEYDNVLQIFQTRAALHKRVYGHSKAKAIDYMVCDAMLAADPVLRITDKAHDPREFVKLDDTILKQIEHYSTFTPGWQRSDMDDSHIARAQSIIRRLRQRDLYKYCGEWPIPTAVLRAGWRQPSPEEIVACASGTPSLSPDDVIVTCVAIDFTAGDRNPLDNVSFFDFPSSHEKKQLMGEHMTKLAMPAGYEERTLRVYSRRSDRASVLAVERAAAQYVKERLGHQVVCRTPQRAWPSDRVSGGGLEDPSRKRKLHL